VARSKTSLNWLKEHFNDPYVKMAQKDGYRSRASYKLLEIQERDRLIRPGMTVIDLGAAPGGWSQVTSRLIGGQGRLIASDILEMDSIPDVTFMHGDFTEDDVLAQILEAVGNTQVDLVISDMAPNMSGLAAVDMPRAMFLCELALDLAGSAYLRPGGDFLIKVFQGEGFDQYHKNMRKLFDKVQMRKPDCRRGTGPASSICWVAASAVLKVLPVMSVSNKGDRFFCIALQIWHNEYCVVKVSQRVTDGACKSCRQCSKLCR
jgi:23S rRNA (uridine2552-2'-O)-methyltransferase